MVKNGSGSALLIMDMINDVAHPDSGKYFSGIKEIEPFILGELNYFRERMRPIFFVNTLKAQDKNESDDAFKFRNQVLQSMSPRTNEVIIKKERPNAFFATELDIHLKKQGITKLTIVGVSSHSSILLSAASALDYGYCVVVPETCISAPNERDHNCALWLIHTYLKNFKNADRPS